MNAGPQHQRSEFERTNPLDELGVPEGGALVGPEERISWLSEHSTALGSANPEEVFPERAQEAIRNLVGDANVVMLGESTHGAGQIFEMKHKIFRFLVEEMNFRSFALEANLTETFAINHFVQTGEGDLRAAIGNFQFQCWQTEELFELAEWMRSWNASHDNPQDRLSFLGFDAQNATGPQREILRLLSEQSPLSKVLKRAFDLVQGITPDEYFTEFYQHWRDQGQATEEARQLGLGEMEIKKNYPRYRIPDSEMLAQCVKRSTGNIDSASQVQKLVGQIVSDERLPAELKHLATLLQQGVLHHQCVLQCILGDRLPLTDPIQFDRETEMAENLRWLLSQSPDKRIVLWAHNDHIAKKPLDQFYTPMGAVLAALDGIRAKAIGFEFGSGEYAGLSLDHRNEDGAPAYKVFQLPEIPEPSLSGELQRASKGQSPVIFDVRTDGTALGRSFKSTSLTVVNIGAVGEDKLERRRPYSLFDAIVYFDTMTAARQFQLDSP